MVWEEVSLGGLESIHLDGRRQRVCMGDMTSEWTTIKRGVP